jgi:hypothetical protein
MYPEADKKLYKHQLLSKHAKEKIIAAQMKWTPCP